MWFIFALLTTLAWGSADLFYKKGSDRNDKFSHVKIVIMVGLIMEHMASGICFLTIFISLHFS